MTPDCQGVMYLPSDHGLWTLDKNGRFHPVDIQGLTETNLSKVCFDEGDRPMMASGNTVYVTGTKPAGANDSARQVLFVRGKFDAPRPDFIRDILHDRNGNFWINNGSVLFRLDQRLQLRQEVSRQSGPRSLNTNSLTKAIIDRSQCLWVCTFVGGLKYCDLNEKLFYTFQHESESPNSLSGNYIRSVLEDGNDLWIGTTANGLNRYDRKAGKFTCYNTYNSPVRLKHDAVESLVLDNDNNCGSDAEPFIIDEEGNIFKTYSYNAFTAANSLSSNYTYPILPAK